MYAPQHTPLLLLLSFSFLQVEPAQVTEFEEVKVDVDAVLGEDPEVGAGCWVLAPHHR